MEQNHLPVLYGYWPLLQGKNTNSGILFTSIQNVEFCLTLWYIMCEFKIFIEHYKETDTYQILGSTHEQNGWKSLPFEVIF